MRDSLQGCIKMISETIADEGWNNGRIEGSSRGPEERNGPFRPPYDPHKICAPQTRGREFPVNVTP